MNRCSHGSNGFCFAAFCSAQRAPFQSGTSTKLLIQKKTNDIPNCAKQCFFFEKKKNQNRALVSPPLEKKICTYFSARNMHGKKLFLPNICEKKHSCKCDKNKILHTFCRGSHNPPPPAAQRFIFQRISITCGSCEHCFPALCIQVEFFSAKGKDGGDLRSAAATTVH